MLGRQGLEWKFTQVFGDKALSDNANEEDIITAMTFSREGRFLAVGDAAGRVVLFEHNQVKKNGKLSSELTYTNEFQSHYKEFDCLKSVDIEQKINVIEFLPGEKSNQFLLTSNDKTIKLWKLGEGTVRRSERFPKRSNWIQSALELPEMKTLDTGVNPLNKVIFPNLHGYNINSVSVCADGERFLSGDDLKVNLWALERTDRAYTIRDIAPKGNGEVNEVLTVSKFDPANDSLFVSCTSKGMTAFCDLRAASRITSPAISFEDPILRGPKNFFSEFLASISDFSFTSNPNLLVTRSLLSVNVWDRRNPAVPMNSIPLYEPLKTKLCALYERELIFDKFDIKVANDSSYLLTGMYGSSFHVCSLAGDSNNQFELNFNRKTIFKTIKKQFVEQLPSSFDINKRVIKTALHPSLDFIVAASINCLFAYNGISNV